MMMRHFMFALLAIPAAAIALAEDVACPDLVTAVQVGTCPAEEELKYTFSGYCSDNARIYKWQEENVCTNYALYRQLKNVALWEAGNGDFQGYLSCDLPPAQIKAAKATSIAVTTQGKLARVACSYGEGISFVYRTKSQCKLAGSGDCANAPAACKARCD